MTMPLRSTARRLLLVLIVLASAGAARADDPLRVLRVTPAGEDVPAARQIVITFDRAMVALGAMSRDRVPVRIRPRVDCHWRWLDTRALACELSPDTALQPGTRYRLAIDTDLAAADGARLASPLHHAFVTRRPRVQFVHFHRWAAADRPLIRVRFDQPVHRASVARHLYFTAVDGDGGRTPASVAAPHPDGEAVLVGQARPEQIAHAALLASSPRRSWLLAPIRGLPADTQIALRVEPGVAGAGPETGVEDRVAVAFHTFGAFEFRGVRCTDVESRKPLVVDDPDAFPGPGRCDPLAGTALLFSSPVAPHAVGGALTLAPPLPGSDPWKDTRREMSTRRVHREDSTYAVWLPAPLPAHQGHRLALDAGRLEDMFGRPLAAPVDLAFGTAHRRPRLHLPHAAAVLEQGVDSHLPAYVTNLERLELNWRSTATPSAGALNHPLPAVEDLAFAVPLPVRDLLGGASGAVSGTIDALPAGAVQDRHRFFAQVTPFAVTVKLGHFSSVAWVTRLDDGSPVPGAALTLYRDSYTQFRGPDAGATGPFVTDADGVARLPGSAVLDPKLALLESWRAERPRLFLRVDKDGDLALLPLDNDFRIWNRGVWPRRQPAWGHLKAWGTTAQGIYRAGDRIDYKLYLRHQDTDGLVPAPSTGYHLSVIDPKGEALVEDEPLTLNRFGAASGTLAIPPGAAVGWYRFRVHSHHGKQTLDAFRVLVSDFTPAPFEVQSTLNGTMFRSGDRLRATTRASLHAGGPYAGAEARVTVRIAGRRLQPGHPLARRFRFGSDDPTPWKTLHQDRAALDGNGERMVETQLEDTGISYGRLQVESAVHDDRGKRVAARAGADFAGRDRFVGLRSPRWLHAAGEPARIEYLVVDADGNPVAGTDVSLALQREVVFTARVKGAGNSYQARHERRWEDAGSCRGTAPADGGHCEFVPATPGRHRVVARIADTRGRPHESTLHTWVRGAGRVTWAQPEDGALDIVAESARLKVGDTARYLVRNPFPGALALVTVERYGVLRSWTERLEGSTPVIEFPVLADDVPGFHLSVTVVSPRVAAPPPEWGQVDLGKPALRMGYVTVPVDDPVKRLDVAVTADAPDYEPGDVATVDLAVTARDSGAMPDQPVELAVAVLDEAVFDLLGNGSRTFDPYAGFYALDVPDVVSYGLLTRLVGRQKFLNKGADPAADGGATPGLRDVSRFVSYWNPSLPVDATGRARIRVTLPGNLTRWRVLALAVTPGERMGLGDGSFTVSKDTELRPVMPNQVRPGDRFRAGFSVLNRAAQARTLDVEITAAGSALEAPVAASRRVTVAPFTRAPLWIDVTAARPGTVRFRARAGDTGDADALAHSLPVLPRGATQTAASHLTLDAGSVEQPIAIPADVAPGSGAIDVTVAQTVLGNLDGAFRHLRDYPYACWEQRLSKAVMASRLQRLRDWLPPNLRWPGSAALPRATLAQAARFQAPNGGMSFWVADDDRVSPYLSAYTAIAFNWLEEDGHTPPAKVRARLDGYLQRMLRREVMPDFYSHGMVSSVRAVALAALAHRGLLGADDVLRYRDAAVHMSVFARAHYLEALWRTLGDHPAVDRVRDMLLAQASESAGKLQFDDPVADAEGKHLLSTPARANCAALASLSTLAADPGAAPALSPLLPKLVRSIGAARGRRDRWENTQENVFCMGALARFARSWEASAPAFSVAAHIDGVPIGEAHFATRRDPPASFHHPLPATAAGTRALLRLSHRGEGRAWLTTRLRYETPADRATRIDAGMSLRREYSVQRNGRWELLVSPFTLNRGDLVRVDLYLSLPTARHFVVVDDPVPGALEPVNRDLATASTLDAGDGGDRLAGDAWWHTRDDWRGFAHGYWSFYHRELRHRAARFFSDYLPAGNYHLTYTAQVIASGEFSVPPAHAEEMYDPEIFANGLPARLRVAADPRP